MDVKKCELLILDETDRLLSMGFVRTSTPYAFTKTKVAQGSSLRQTENSKNHTDWA